ncbi:hypothetical protein F8568_021795 [Actinomadura sp. LD22]|uniref:Bacterial transcriptional activator domain-containing protein n=1 Tax=Actinomadura physcomitrii TaxID=2650748 RepID=A0A6I4MB01_9ACTN|nr:hypothetical protein [Actinomadura physcomitrii]MWA02962.1 hypothetical protein [Actinomadura physcomitrii]
MLGPVLLHTADGPITTGLRTGAKHLLAYLALHPKGATRDQAIGTLWPDATPQSAVNAFNSATSSIRGVLRTATGLTEPRFLIHTAGRYRIDHDLVDVDLWQLTATLADAKRAAADDTDSRINALAQVSDLYTGGFAEDFGFSWAETYREHLRRTVVDALGHYVQLVKEDKPELALATLERASWRGRGVQVVGDEGGQQGLDGQVVDRAGMAAAGGAAPVSCPSPARAVDSL